MKRITLFILVIVYAFAVYAAAQPSDGSILHKDLTGLGSFIRSVLNLGAVAMLALCIYGAWAGYKRLSRNEANGGSLLALCIGVFILFSILFVSC